MGSLSLLTAPVGEPIGLQEAKEHCRFDLNDEDASFDGFIAGARQRLELVTNRQLLIAQWRLTREGWPCWIEIPRPPLFMDDDHPLVIAYVDTAGVTQTLATDQYRVDAPSGPTAQRARIDPAYGVTWPTLRDVSSNVTVTFWAGYGVSGDAVPIELRQAMLMHIFAAHHRRGLNEDETRAFKAKWVPFLSSSVQRQ